MVSKGRLLTASTTVVVVPVVHVLIDLLCVVHVLEVAAALEVGSADLVQSMPLSIKRQLCSESSSDITYARIVVRASEVRRGAPGVVGRVELLGNVLEVRVRACEVDEGEVALGAVLQQLSNSMTADSVKITYCTVPVDVAAASMIRS